MSNVRFVRTVEGITMKRKPERKKNHYVGGLAIPFKLSGLDTALSSRATAPVQTQAQQP